MFIRREGDQGKTSDGRREEEGRKIIKRKKGSWNEGR